MRRLQDVLVYVSPTTIHLAHPGFHVMVLEANSMQYQATESEIAGMSKQVL